MRYEIRFAGFGGQGVVLASQVLSYAVVLSGRYAAQSQSYGPEARGGAARGEVVVADEPIDYPRVTDADVLVAMSQPAYERYHTQVRTNGVLVIDADLVDARELPPNVRLYKVPATSLAAERIGNRLYANMIMVGFVAALSQLVDLPTLERAIMERIPEKHREPNLQAVRLGYELGVSSR